MTLLYAVVDPALCRGRDPAVVAAAAARGGAAIVQYRWKGPSVPNDDRSAEARRVVLAARAAGARAFVNDRIDWALAAAADGVHLGTTDASPAEARRLAGGLAIGLSAHTLEEARAAAAARPDYVSFGPVWPTGSKPDHAPVVGVDLLRRACAAVDRPVCAVGGLTTPARAAACAAAGAAMTAVLSAICAAEDPEAAARAFSAALRARAA